MKLVMLVGLPGQIVLDVEPAPPPKKTQPPNFLAHIRCGQTAGWIKMPLGTEVGRGSGDFVLHGDPPHASPKRRRSPISNFRPMSIVAKQMDGSR